MLYYAMLYYNILYYDMLLCYVYYILYYDMLSMLCYIYAMLYYNMLCYNMICYTMLYYAIVYYAVPHYTILHYTVLYYTRNTQKVSVLWRFTHHLNTGFTKIISSLRSYRWIWIITLYFGRHLSFKHINMHINHQFSYNLIFFHLIYVNSKYPEILK